MKITIVAVMTFVTLSMSALAGGRAWAGGSGRRCLSGAINLNTASAEELQRLPGVGPARADSILAYRKARPFRTVEELSRIKGIGRKTVKKLRPHLQVQGETTLRSELCAAPVERAPEHGPAREGDIRLER